MTQGPRSSQDKQWSDLSPRLLTSFLLIIVGVAFMLLGGVWFQMLIVFVTAVMVWELAMLINAKDTTCAMLLAAGVATVISGLLATPQTTPHMLLICVPAVIGALVMPKERVTFLIFTLAISLAGWGLIMFRDLYGVIWLLWMVGVVVVTDVGGYFGGRFIGGPKFWPRISPKKTWAGTATGWILAAALGVGVMYLTQAGAPILIMSILLSVVSQFGDIAQSALKRRMGAKDSSMLLPGHGGLFDRFDGLLGASICLLVLSLVMEIPKISA